MTHEQKTQIQKVAKQIIRIATTKKDAKETISVVIYRIAVNSAKDERKAWEDATESMTPKQKEKLLKARYGGLYDKT